MTEKITCVADETVEDLVYSIEAVRVQMKVLKEQDDTLITELKELVGESELIVDPTGHELATWKVSQSRRFNTDKFKKDWPCLYVSFVETSESSKLIIKPRKI